MVRRRKGNAEIVRWIGAFLLVATVGVGIIMAYGAMYPLARYLTSDVDEERALVRVFWGSIGLLWSTYGTTVAAGLGALVAGAVARAVARARLRAGHVDPLERVRGFVAAHPRAAAAVTALPGVAWGIQLANMSRHRLVAQAVPWETTLIAFVVPAGLALLTHVILARRGLRALLAPTLADDLDDEEDGEEDAEGFTFEAVAVTRETVAAVVGLVVLTIAVLVFVLKLPFHLVPRAWSFGVVSAYAVFAAVAAFLFQRTSRVSIGLDGVLIGGSSRQRFFAYRDLDDVKTWGRDLELLAQGRVVLRLQLHSKDANRRRALLARLRREIELAKAHRADPASAFVASAKSAELARVAEGASSYRTAAPSRDKLWEMFESPVLDGDARQSVGEALATGLESAERERFRIAAEHCADPSVRLRLHELLEPEGEDDARESSRARMRASS